MNNPKKKKERKPLNQLTLMDPFLFNAAVSQDDILQNILSIIFSQDNFPAIRYGITEKTLDTKYDSRAVRLDLLALDENDTVYDTEPQNRNTGFMNLCKRSRYYQACIDVNLLEPGDVDFAKLNNVFVSVQSQANLCINIR